MSITVVLLDVSDNIPLNAFPGFAHLPLQGTRVAFHYYTAAAEIWFIYNNSI